MRYGTVVRYFPDKGFGFIRPDSGPDVFFHITALGACQAQPRIEPGQPVKYELMARAEVRQQQRPEPGHEATATPPQPEEEAGKTRQPPQLRAKMVELIDKIPGGSLEESAGEHHSARHPRARRKKPSWRR